MTMLRSLAEGCWWFVVTFGLLYLMVEVMKLLVTR